MQTTPQIWKSADIIPIPKSKRATAAKEYRPIALTAILALCLERLIAPHITAHISNENQYAYRKNRGTDDALVGLLDTITNHLNKLNTNYVQALFIHYSSSFNTIDNSNLIEKMKSKGINSNITAWAYHLLTDQKQMVRTNGAAFNSISTTAGSPAPKAVY